MQSTPEQRAALEAYVQRTAIECENERDPLGQDRERCAECSAWFSPNRLYKCVGLSPLVYTVCFEVVNLIDL